MNPIEIFCKFDFEGNITPARIKVVDLEGMAHVYDIQKSKLINVKITNGVKLITCAMERFMDFECEIEVDNIIKVIKIRFVIPEHRWEVKM